MAHTMWKVAAVAGVLGAALAAQAATPWNQPSGNGAFFTWANGQNETNLFGSPTLVGGVRLVFFPDSFTANAVNGNTATAHDRFDVDLFALVGYKFTEIRIETIGDYSIVGDASAAVSGGMAINEIGGPRSSNDPLLANIPMPVTSGSGNWQSAAIRDLSLVEGGTPFTQIHISFTNDLIAISSGNGHVATINKTVVGFPVAVTIIPGPGALAVLGLGGMLAARRRR
jgi:hypothetical protein